MKLLIILFLVSFQSRFTQSLNLIADLDNESPNWSASFIESNGIVYFNTNCISNSTGKKIIDNNVQLELELNSPIYDLTPHVRGLNYILIGINQTLFKL